MKIDTKRIKARKYVGDDLYSWAVFIDARPWVTGLGRSEVPYYKRRAQEKIDADAEKIYRKDCAADKAADQVLADKMNGEKESKEKLIRFQMGV